MNHTKIVLGAALISFTAAFSTANAAITVDSDGFFGVTDGSISTTGLADWGYISVAGGFFGVSYNNTDYGSLTDGTDPISTVSGSSSIGLVTLTEGTSGTDTVGPQTQVPNFTFGGTQAHGSYGNFAPTEDNIWQMSFNDLGVGQFVIKLYMGHSSNDRIFDMDVSGTGITPFTTTSAQIGTLGSTVAAYGTSGSAFTYDITVTTTDAADDLTLTFGGISGGFGGAIFSGYTVEAVPEPSVLGLIGFAGMAILMRRRRR